MAGKSTNIFTALETAGKFISERQEANNEKAKRDFLNSDSVPDFNKAFVRTYPESTLSSSMIESNSKKR